MTDASEVLVSISDVNHVPTDFIQFSISHCLRRMRVFEGMDLQTLIRVEGKVPSLKLKPCVQFKRN